MMIAVDRGHLLLVSGTGDVIQPTDGVAAIGSGGPYALAAARALIACIRPWTRSKSSTPPSASPATLCIYTNRNMEVETIE